MKPKTIGEHEARDAGIRECVAILEDLAAELERGASALPRDLAARNAAGATEIRHAAAVVRRRLGLTGWPVERVAS